MKSASQPQRRRRTLEQAYDLYRQNPHNAELAARLLVCMRKAGATTHKSISASEIARALNTPNVQKVLRWPAPGDESVTRPICHLVLTTPLAHRRLWCGIEYSMPRGKELEIPEAPAFHFVGLPSKWRGITYGSVDFDKALRAISRADDPQKTRGQFAQNMKRSVIIDYGELTAILALDNLPDAWAYLRATWLRVFPEQPC